MGEVGKTYRKLNYSTRKYENLTFYDIMWKIYSRLEDRGYVQGADNVQSETLKIIYDTLERKIRYSSIETLYKTVENILSNKIEENNLDYEKSIEDELKNASVDTKFVKIGGHY